ncbi:MIZ/SP-RING zinc finger-domain-containing protein [Piptocephalis cylindrospora]|uniref:MIZ/SP-RING zinc finger-domain-containing protein n=1 Tax=Piptocephalis cylindrospora TaxID=1907219 RepID=A0A4P9Y2Q4_9FUNG|nr:MIZ/SP-RING zinc finger-domain-containing protein [Piptocephalis cylindrospora]|eukprot:RKP13063.1 MIZ/SP-RING zinc finger-domain-containing protein [Piptocephalis cylindrospora]
MAYVNLTKPLVGAIYMGEVYSVQSVMHRLTQECQLSKAHVLEEMVKRCKKADEEDEVLATRLTLSLKCPLGFNRIRVPVRSKICRHSQCWDALNYLELNAQTPTWQCPHCEKFLPERSLSDLLIDGYFTSLLQSTPESMESVVISEEDGSVLDIPIPGLIKPSVPSPSSSPSSSPLTPGEGRVASPLGIRAKGRRSQRAISPYERRRQGSFPDPMGSSDGPEPLQAVITLILLVYPWHVLRVGVLEGVNERPEYLHFEPPLPLPRHDPPWSRPTPLLTQVAPLHAPPPRSSLI